MKIIANALHIKGEFILETAKYQDTGGLCLMLKDEDGYPVATLTTNLGFRVNKGYIAVKDYSENTGASNILIDNGIIESQPIEWITAGFVKVPIFKLTEKGLSL
jgi:hypothetical protein